MVRAGAVPPLPTARNLHSPASSISRGSAIQQPPQQQDFQNQSQALQNRQKDAGGAPVLPPVGESRPRTAEQDIIGSDTSLLAQQPLQHEQPRSQYPGFQNRQKDKGVAPTLPPVGESRPRTAEQNAIGSDRATSTTSKEPSSYGAEQQQALQLPQQNTSGSSLTARPSTSTPAALPYMTPPPIPQSQLGPFASVRDDDVAEHRRESFSEAFEQAMQQKNAPKERELGPWPEGEAIRRSPSPSHPAILRPGSSGANSRRASLEDVRGQPSIQAFQSDSTPEDAVFLHNDRAQKPMVSPAAATPYGHQSPNGGRLADALSRESTTAGHYNTVPFRSHTPSSTSMVSGKTTSGQPPVGASRRMTQSSDSVPLQQTPEESEISRPVPAGIVANPSQRKAVTGQDQLYAKQRTTVSDGPGPMYPVSSRDEDANHVTRGESIGKSESNGNSKTPGLAIAIKNRASKSDLASPTSSGGPDSRPNTRQSGSITTNTPTSQAPTSASEYSQNTAIIDSFPQTVTPSESTPSAEIPAHLPQPNMPHDTPTGNTPGSGAFKLGSERYSKAPSSAISEGQDDYIAGLNFLALTAQQEGSYQPQRVASSSDPAYSPQSSVAASATQRPSISIKTNAVPPIAQEAPLHQVDGNALPANASPTSDYGEPPRSPDPYGTNTEQPPAPTSNSLSVAREGSLRREKSDGRGPGEPRMFDNGFKTRKPGRGAPQGRRTGRMLGTWDSDEEDSENGIGDKEAEESQEFAGEDQARKNVDHPTNGHVPQPQAVSSTMDTDLNLRLSTSSAGSIRRHLPQLPGPSTDPYINRNSPPMVRNERGSHYEAERGQYAQYGQQDGRGSMYGWPQPTPMGGMAPWQMQMQMPGLHPGQQRPSFYGHSPSPSMYGGQGSSPMQNASLVNLIPQDPQMVGADARAGRQGALAPHGLLQTGLQNQQQRSAAAQEASARENGGPLVQLDPKAQGPQGGLVGAIANHERDRKREGGIGATLTERERERRASEARQRDMDHMHQRHNSGYGGSPYGAYPGGNMPGMPGPGGNMPGIPGPGMGYGGYNMDPMQMQQRKLACRR